MENACNLKTPHNVGAYIPAKAEYVSILAARCSADNATSFPVVA